MKNLYLIAALSLFGVCGIVARADGAERAKKPTVCLDYEVLKPGLAVCSDAKKPFLMRSFVVVMVPGTDDVPVKALVGWR